MSAPDSLGAKSALTVGGRTFEIFRLDALERRGLAIARLPYSLKILLENLLRREDGRAVRAADIERLARWDPAKTPDEEIAFMPARVLLQDFTGVPAVVDLASMRDAIRSMGGNPKDVNPLLPAELVIDHSVIVDQFGTRAARETTARARETPPEARMANLLAGAVYRRQADGPRAAGPKDSRPLHIHFLLRGHGAGTRIPAQAAPRFPDRPQQGRMVQPGRYDNLARIAEPIHSNERGSCVRW